MKFNVEITELTHQDLVDILSGAMSGCSYWCSHINYDKAEYEIARNEYKKTSNKDYCCYENVLAQMLTSGKTLFFEDGEEDREYALDLEILKKGIAKAIRNGVANADNFDDADDETYDCIIQYALLGEVVYG